MHSRTGRHLRGATVLLTGALALAACSSTTGSAASGTAVSAPPTSSNAAPAPAPRIAPATVTPATFSGPAVDAFGAEALQVAYAEVGEYLSLTTFDETLMARDATPADFEFATEYMTATMAAAYRTIVQEALAEHGPRSDADTELNTMSFFQIDGNDEGVTVRPSGEIVTDHAISDAEASVASTGSLEMVVTETARWHVDIDGAPSTLPVTKTATFFLVPNDGTGGRHPWLINGQQSAWQAGQITPDTAG